MKTKGFTLIELLVVIVIIGILVAIALPNFIKIKAKAQEAEVKQNLHSIQLAIERYATDLSGNYPFFLFGGDSLYNCGTANNIFTNGDGWINGNWYHAFDAFAWAPTDAWGYSDGTPNLINTGQMEQGWGDTIQYEAYMTKYPRNPFSIGEKAKNYNADAANNWNLPYAGWGGRDGDLMFNTGPFGDRFALLEFDGGAANAEEPGNDFPGQFYYHPRWADGVSNYGHQLQQAAITGGVGAVGGCTPVPLDDSAEVASLDVAGYDLVAIGSRLNKGQDLDLPVALSGWDNRHTLRTGYLTLGQERNPYVSAGDYGSNGDYEERPFSDGKPDFIIIHLSSGIDRKVSDTTGVS